jgi:hypothetical protein
MRPSGVRDMTCAGGSEQVAQGCNKDYSCCGKKRITLFIAALSATTVASTSVFMLQGGNGQWIGRGVKKRERERERERECVCVWQRDQGAMHRHDQLAL